jgi:hypothetical protein
MHSGIYALQKSVRQMRGTATAQVPAPRSLCHSVGGMFAASGTIIMAQRGTVGGEVGSRRGKTTN